MVHIHRLFLSKHHQSKARNRKYPNKQLLPLNFVSLRNDRRVKFSRLYSRLDMQPFLACPSFHAVYLFSLSPSTPPSLSLSSFLPNDAPKWMVLSSASYFDNFVSFKNSNNKRSIQAPVSWLYQDLLVDTIFLKAPERNRFSHLLS